MTKHTLLSPSSAYRWRRCPASAAVAAAHPDTGSEFADEGTAAHELAAWCLTEERDALAYLGRVIEVPARDGGPGRVFTVDQTMADYVQGYVDRCREWLNFAGATLFVEQSLSIESITGEADACGTSDAVIVIPGAQGVGYDLVIRDLKYGRGVPVEAHENDQLMIYAWAALEQFGIAFDFRDDAQVHMEIDQPRRGHTDRFTLTVTALRERIEAIRKDAAVALVTPADGCRYAGDWCKFCPIRATCATRAKWVSESIGETPTASSDAERLAGYLSRVDAIRDWCAAVEKEALARLSKGESLPGWKLVTGKAGDRKWTDEEHAATALISFGAHREQIYTAPKLKSPAQIEKLIPKGARVHLDNLISRAEGKPTIAPESDPRPALSGRLDGFDNLDAVGAESIV